MIQQILLAKLIFLLVAYKKKCQLMILKVGKMIREN
nr:MAG TPA: hypothetical protein [Caudoviricetes sp.]